MDTLPSMPIATMLRQRLIEDMTVRGFSEKTRRCCGRLRTYEPRMGLYDLLAAQNWYIPVKVVGLSVSKACQAPKSRSTFP